MTTAEIIRNTKSQKLPDGWRWAYLGETGRFDSGGTPSKENFQFWNGNIPFITGADITQLYISSKNARTFLTELGLKSGKTAICEPGTILFVTRTRVGRIGIATELMGASQDLSPFICGKEILPEFVAHYISSISDSLIENCRGATIQGLTREFIHRIEIPLPPLTEQKRIVKILNEQMAVVQKARTAAESRLKAAKALPSAYLRAIFESEEAKSWTTKQIGEICGVATGGTPSTNHPEYYSDEIPWLKSGDIQGIRIFHVPNRISKLGLKNSNAVVHPVGSVMIALSGQGKTRGTASILMTPSACSQSVASILPSSYILPEFIYFTLFYKYKNIRLLTGDNERTGLNLKIVRNISIPVPEIKFQKEIVSMLEDKINNANNLIMKCEHELEAINSLPTALLWRAFTGGL